MSQPFQKLCVCKAPAKRLQKILRLLGYVVVKHSGSYSFITSVSRLVFVLVLVRLATEERKKERKMNRRRLALLALDEEDRPSRPSRRYWVHPINLRRQHLGEYHRLVQELRLDDERFQVYFRLNKVAACSRSKESLCYHVT